MAKLKLVGSEAEPVNRELAKRWTEKLVKDGWTGISDVFLENYTQLTPPLTPEAMFVIQLMRHKWDERNPFPSFKTLARRMGISMTATRGHARSLDRKKYLRRIKREGQPNEFDLKPLFSALEKYKDEKDAEKAKEGKRSA